jgi:hypothetical protein
MQRSTNDQELFKNLIKDGQIEALKDLLRISTLDINATLDEKGNTGIMEALNIENEEKRNAMVAFLTKYGANKYQKNSVQQKMWGDGKNSMSRHGINFHSQLSILYVNNNEFAERERQLANLDEKLKEHWQSSTSSVHAIENTFKFYISKKNANYADYVKALGLTQLGKEHKTDEELFAFITDLKDQFQKEKQPKPHALAMVSFDYCLEKLEQRIGEKTREEIRSVSKNMYTTDGKGEVLSTAASTSSIRVNK